MNNKTENYYAAVDLGSNSFHMVVAEMIDNQMHVIDRHKDMVRLANGLDERGNLTPEKIADAMISLKRIEQRIRHIPKSHVRIVGTNTLRKAKNAEKFMLKAEKALGKSIEIISGREEARILYLGVAHSLPSNQGKKLVIDIGGGSTELIIGEDFEPMLRESLHMGCVSYTKRYFRDGQINKENWNKAVLYATRQLQPILSTYKNKGWNLAIGASGTMRATSSVLLENGWSHGEINPEGMQKLLKQCYKLGTTDNLIQLPGLSSRRSPVFIGGLAIIQGLLQALEIEQIDSCTGALREGLIYDLSGRLNHNDIRKRTIEKLCNQFETDNVQSELVQSNINKLLAVADVSFTESQLKLLKWASRLHELGLKISHSHFESHAAYILIHADMPGFAIQQQLKLAVIVASQRRKIKKDWLKIISSVQLKKIQPLIIIFRLAVLLSRSRVEMDFGIHQIEIKDYRVVVHFDENWLQQHSLTQLDMKSEQTYMNTLGIDYILVS